ncbi:MAG: serine O-acetyltransferase [Tannerella sp.]|nr:serine O-acetyltransferase [Tannerella sp.]
MYSSTKKIWTVIKSDYIRYGKKATFFRILTEVLFVRNYGFVYSFWLRLSAEKNLFNFIARIQHFRLTRKYGIQIGRKTKIGNGLYIGHGIGIVVNPNAEIGNNCNISQFTTIGGHYKKAAKIGNNVYIGPNVCIVGNVNVGDNVTIGAGAVVTKDIPDNATVAGVPAKILSFKNPGRFVNYRYIE